MFPQIPTHGNFCNFALFSIEQESIIDYDTILVLEHGEIVEYDSPAVIYFATYRRGWEGVDLYFFYSFNRIKNMLCVLLMHYNHSSFAFFLQNDPYNPFLISENVHTH